LGSTQLSTLQAILSSQVMVVPPHTPLVHLSPVVQALLSPQGVLSGLFGLEQVPSAVLQVPASWHWSLAVQVTKLPPVHLPVWQVSILLQAFESSHAVPSFLLGVEQTPVELSHVPTA
jgi:hypothetical protein